MRTPEDLDRLTRLGVAPYASGALAGVKSAEASDLHLVACSQGLHHAPQHGLEDKFRFPTRDLDYTRNFFDQVGFGHGRLGDNLKSYSRDPRSISPWQEGYQKPLRKGGTCRGCGAVRAFLGRKGGRYPI